MKEELIKQIRKNYLSVTGQKNNRLQLPKHIGFNNLDDGKILVSIKKEHVIENMQNNNSAFESWIFAIKRWSIHDSFVLKWARPENTSNAHYQRFLYRVEKFNKLYNWFEIDQECSKYLSDLKVNSSDLLILNIPKSKSKPPENLAGNPSKMTENKLEWYIHESDLFTRKYGLVKLKRQLPVGLFYEKVNSDNYIFTGQSSAIDLWGIDNNNAVNIFELKKFDNKPIGIISELFFYTMVIYDLIQKRFLLSKESNTIFPDRGDPGEIVNKSSIKSFFTANVLHPLLDSSLIDLMNEMGTTKVPITFDHIMLEEGNNL